MRDLMKMEYLKSKCTQYFSIFHPTSFYKR